MDTERENLQALHQRDLLLALDKLGIKEDFEQGKILCKFCKDIITLENVHSILPESGMVNFVCNKPDCIAKLMEYITDK